MESNSRSTTPTIPFKSKKRKNPVDKHPQNATDQSPVIKTPEKKLLDQPRRIQNQNRALSISEVRRAAQKLQVSSMRKEEDAREAEGGLQAGVRVSENDEVKGRGAVKRRDSIVLPEKHEVLCEFFNAMVSSFQLLRLKRSSSTFMNISPMVESMMGRRFTVDHLAQLKYVLPEAILIKRIRVKDEVTSCMKEELFVTLDAEALRTNEKIKDVVGPSLLKKVFRLRVFEYLKTHSEDDDIPKGAMASLFNLPVHANGFILSESKGVSAASHNPPSLKKQFSHKCSSPVEESMSNVVGSPASCVEVGKTSLGGCPTSCPEEPRPIKCPISQLPSSSVLATPTKMMTSQEHSMSRKGDANICKTPAGVVSTPMRLMTDTPSLKPEKRCFMSPDDNSFNSPKKLLRRSDRIKSLKFGPPEDDAAIEDHTVQHAGSILNQELDFLPESLLQSVWEEEQKMLEDMDPAISQAKKRHQMMARLPQLFDTIHFLVQSIGRTVITKKEFMYKIIVGQREIMDRGEVEEQLKLLQELAPEYLSEQLCSSGDTMIRFNKFSCPETIRAKLREAK